MVEFMEESMPQEGSTVQSEFDLEWEQWEFIVDPSTFEWEQDEEGQWWYITSDDEYWHPYEDHDK